MIGRGLLALGFVACLTGCGMPAVIAANAPVAPIGLGPLFTVTVPSTSGIPNSVVTYGSFAFVSVQGTGQIFTYNLSTGTPVQVGSPYATPCTSPSGMVIAAIAGAMVMAVPCYDADSLLTLTVHTNGSLSALGSVNGLPAPFPGIVLDGTDVYVPLYGQSLVANGAVAKVSLASPARPVVTATMKLASPSPGVYVNPGYLSKDGGYIYVLAGSENQPWATTSSVQVLSEATLSMVAAPFMVDHSPQQIAISQGVAFVTSYDDEELQSIDISDPTHLRLIQTLSLASNSCTALSILVRENFAYVGCYNQAVVDRINIADPANMSVDATLPGIAYPQRIAFSPLHYLVVTDSHVGGSLYQIDAGRF